jgi:hypothetical protein
MQLDKISMVNLIAAFRQPHGIATWPSTNIGDNGWWRRHMSSENVLRALEFYDSVWLIKALTFFAQ